MALTKEQFNSLRQKGLSIDQIVAFEKGETPTTLAEQKVRANEGFAKSTFRAITEPVATLATRPFQLAKALGGANEREQAVKLPFYGTIKSPSSVKDVVKDVGRGLETVSLGIGGTGAVSSVRAGLRGLIKQGAIEGTKIGAKSGALTSFGMSLQEAVDKKPEEAYKSLITDTLIGTGLGAVTGGVFGATTPVIAKGVNKAKEFTQLPALQQKLSDGYKKILNPNARQIKVDQRFGGDSFEFLSKEAPDLPFKVNSNGRLELDDAIEMAKTKYAAEATAYKPIIKNSGRYVNIEEVVADAKKNASQTFDGSDLEKAYKQIDDEINAFLKQNPDDVIGSKSGRLVSIDRADDIKSYSWSRGKGWGSPDAEVWNDTNNLIGHSLKDAIEKEIPEAPIRAMNKRLGQWKSAIDMLERRNGQVSGSGGKLTKLLTQSVGTSIGGMVGGQGEEGGRSLGGALGGASAGFITANALAALMANPNVRLSIIRQIIKRLQTEGKTSLVNEAQKILQEQSSKYLLPARTLSTAPENTINLPKSARETNLGLDEIANTRIGYKPSLSQQNLPKTKSQLTDIWEKANKK